MKSIKESKGSVALPTNTVRNSLVDKYAPNPIAAMTEPHEESFLEECRRRVEEQYAHTQLGSGCVGGCFGSILCHELHMGNDPEQAGLHFSALAEKWGIPVTVLGELIWDHCKRLEPQLQVNHDYR